jgi:hypothetical protein
LASLKAYIPRLARWLETTPTALYERQRALVAAGYLDATEGRGPGSGVRLGADGYVVATLLISVLATDSLSQVERRFREIGAAERRTGSNRRQRPTERSHFLDAIAELLNRKKWPREVTEIIVSRTSPTAIIGYVDHDGSRHETIFAGAGQVPNPALQVFVKLDGKLLRQIADDLLDASGRIEEEPDGGNLQSTTKRKPRRRRKDG